LTSGHDVRRRSRVRAEALSRGVPPQGSRSSGRWPSRCLVAADLGTSAQTIYAWRKQELVGTGQQPGLSRAEQTELSAANKRIRELENKVAILKRPVSCSESHTTRRSIRGGLLRMAITGPSQRAIRHVWLTELDPCRAFRASRGTYGGARRVHSLVNAL